MNAPNTAALEALLKAPTKVPMHDVQAFLADEEVIPFEDDQRQDLTGTGAQACDIVSTGVFIVHKHKVPDNTAEIVLGMFPHAWSRINVGGDPAVLTTAEAEQLIDARLLAGGAVWDLDTGKKQPFQVSHDYNIGTISTSPNNTQRSKVRGTTFVSSDEPVYASNGMMNSLRAMYFPGGSEVRVLFRIVPGITPFTIAIPANHGLPGAWTVGSGEQTIAFAGAKVFGVRLPQQRYKQLMIARGKGELGPEGAGSVLARLWAKVAGR